MNILTNICSYSDDNNIELATIYDIDPKFTRTVFKFYFEQDKTGYDIMNRFKKHKNINTIELYNMTYKQLCDEILIHNNESFNKLVKYVNVRNFIIDNSGSYDEYEPYKQLFLDKLVAFKNLERLDVDT